MDGSYGVIFITGCVMLILIVGGSLDIKLWPKWKKVVFVADVFVAMIAIIVLLATFP